MQRFLFIGLLLFGWSCLGAKPTSDGYANRKIEQLAKEMPIPIPSNDTLISVPSIVKGKSIAFQYNEEKELSHIGISLFSEETKFLLDKSICDFIERCFLELIQQRTAEDVKRKLEEYHIELVMDNKSFGVNGFTSVSSALEAMNMPVNFSLDYQGYEAKAEWTYEHHRLAMSFPLYRELIEGTDKKESDRHVYHQLEAAVSNPLEVSEDSVTIQDLPSEDGIVYIHKGETYMIKNLTSNRYYMYVEGALAPVFDERYPEYSLSNLFLVGGRNAERLLSITHRQYGHFTPEINLPIYKFINVFKKDFFTYCHAGQTKDGELEAIVVFTHKTLNYIHLLRLHTDKEILFDDSTRMLKADFYSNIPQHYLKSLIQ